MSGAAVAHVTAVVVTRGSTGYLPRTLSALGAQSRPPERVLLVDAGPDDAQGREGELLPLLEALPDPSSALLVVAAHARTFGDAVRRALALPAAASSPAAPGQVRAGGVPAGGVPVAGVSGASGASRTDWLWLLHDDSAPEPGALAALLRAVEVAPSVAVAGCKQRTWDGPVRVVEVGLTTSRFGRRMTGLDGAEVDQGQHDGREDVLAVGLAGALVRRDVWDALGGPDPALGPYGDGLDLSRRARLAGHRVVVVPAAVVRHAQATLHRGGRPGWDARRATQARREAFLHGQLTSVPAPLVPLVALVALLSGVVRGLGRMVLKEPHLVVAELAAPLAVLGRPGRIVAARRRARATRRVRRRSLRPLEVTWREVVREARDRRLTAAELRRTRQAPSELEVAELSAVRTRRRAGLALVVVAALAVTAATVGPVLLRVLAGARASGPGLAVGDADLGALWTDATSGWVAGGLGARGPSDPFLAVLLPVTALVGEVGRAAALVVLSSLVLSAVGAWAAAGAATRSVGVRAWAALVWTASPALLLALDEARVGAVVAHAVLPWVTLGVARAVGVARVDVVESGLVGASFADDGRAHTPVPVRPRTAEPSLAAAAAAGLAFAVVTAAAPALLPAGLLALALVAVAAPRRRRLVWVAAPALALAGPTLAAAAGGWSAGGWRLLLADPGVPVASTGAPAWQVLLGWPVPAPDVVVPDGLAALDGLLPLVATGAVVLVAALALAGGSRGSRAARAGWVVAACGLGVAVAVAAVPLALTPGGELTGGWSGPGVSLVLAGVLLAALVGLAGARAGLARHAFGWRQVAAVVVAVVVVGGPLAVLGSWTAGVRTSGPGVVASDVPVVPAVGTQMQRSAEAARVLLLDLDDGVLVGTLLRGDGVQLTEVSRSVTARGVVGQADGSAPADLADPDPASDELAGVVARVSVGAPGVADDLAALAVGAVLVPPADGDEQADDGGAASGADGRVELLGRLDSTDGLERVTETESGVLWRVATVGTGRTTAWARFVPLDASSSPDDGSVGPDDGAAPRTVPSDGRTVDALLSELGAASGGAGATAGGAATSAGLLVLAERADPGWRAWLDGRPLRAVETSWRQAFEVPPAQASARLTVAHVVPGRTPWLVLQATVILLAALLALPVRRRRGGR